MIEIKTLSDFQTAINNNDGTLSVVNFWADWAPQCKQMNDAIEELTKDTIYINCKFLKVEAEEVAEVSKKFKLEGVPTVIFIRNGSEIDRVVGAKVADVNKKVQIHGAPSAGIPSYKPKVEDLDVRLKKLINKAPVVLFMKGNPNEPKCGFSRQITQILKDQSITYETFDILTDEEVRQGLKKFSNWPTYPQLYANGELIGGLDIVKEYVETDELKSVLPTVENLDDRLKKLINQHQIMLFMKGSPAEPRCGFSKATIEILNDTKLSFDYFNILDDDLVRQGLKIFSNWPTYPQIYVQGELIGGLDILKELKETDELLSTLNNTS